MKFKKITVLIVLSFTHYFSQAQLPNFDRPCGIYVLGANQPGNQLNAIRDYSFIDGYALRIDWEDIEISQGIYDFTVIDQAINQLETNNQKLTLALFTKRVPSYIPLLPNAEFYWDHDSTLNILPWDTVHIPYLHTFLDALGSHLVPDHSQGGTLVQFRNHPVFAQINAQFPGLGGIRDIDGDVVNHPNYNRTTFTNATINTIQMYIDLFPNQYRYVAFFGISDGITVPKNLKNHLLDEYNLAFNSGVQPLLGYFAENLACSSPAANMNQVLFTQKNTTFTMMQMLESWRTPHMNGGAATIPCLTDSTGPDIGMAYGLDNFNTTYFELYLTDIEWLQYNSLFTLWQDSLSTLCGQSTTTGVKEFKSNSLNIYPNPTTGKLTIKGDIKIESISIYDLSGKKFYSRKNIGLLIHTIDLSSIPNGIYYIRLEDKNKKNSYTKLIKQE